MIEKRNGCGALKYERSHPSPVQRGGGRVMTKSDPTKLARYFISLFSSSPSLRSSTAATTPLLPRQLSFRLLTLQCSRFLYLVVVWTAFNSAHRRLSKFAISVCRGAPGVCLSDTFIISLMLLRVQHTFAVPHSLLILSLLFFSPLRIPLLFLQPTLTPITRHVCSTLPL